MQEAGDRHVVQTDEPIEADAGLVLQLRLPAHLIAGGELLQLGAAGIAHQGELPRTVPLAVAVGIETAQGFYRGLPGALPPLGVGAALLRLGQAGDDFHLVFRQKTHEVAQGWQQQNREVAAVDHMAVPLAGGTDQIAKTRVQFGGSTGEIQHLRPEPVDGCDAGLDHRVTHLGVALMGAGIHVAVGALHVAELAEIELEHPQSTALGRGGVMAAQGGLEAQLRRERSVE